MLYRRQLDLFQYLESVSLLIQEAGSANLTQDSDLVFKLKYDHQHLSDDLLILIYQVQSRQC